MIKFFCVICIDDKEMYAERIDSNNAYGTCPDCGASLIESFTRHPGVTVEDMTTESYLQSHGLDTNTP
jgi:hypothetical protein